MSKPQKCISVQEAKVLQSKWVETRATEIEKAQGYQDTREFWYSLEELQEFLDYVREESANQGVNRPGVRIYFGAYPKTNEKKSYATIFLAPTKEKSALEEEEFENSAANENNYDIDPLNDGTGGLPPTGY